MKNLRKVNKFNWSYAILACRFAFHTYYIAFAPIEVFNWYIPKLIENSYITIIPIKRFYPVDLYLNSVVSNMIILINNVQGRSQNTFNY